jgi:hypothetical protein
MVVITALNALEEAFNSFDLGDYCTASKKDC